MEEENKKGFFSRKFDSFLNFMLSDNPKKWVILIIFLATILRVWIVPKITPQVADEMVHGPHAMGVIGSGALNMQNQCPVWFYLTDIAYKIFGINSFGMRFLSIFFGILMIPLIYLLAKKFFNTKIALLASFFWAISAYVIRYSLGEMDIAMAFFVLLAIYFFFDSFIKKEIISYYVFIFMAIAVLTKPISLMFIPGFAIVFFIFLYKKQSSERKEFLKKNSKKIFIGSLIFLIFMSPVLVYNYLLYNEKQITDVLFSRFLHVSPELYQQLQGFEVTFSAIRIVNDGPLFLWHTFPDLNPLISLFGVLGFILIFFKKNLESKCFLFLWLIPFLFLLGTSHLQTHFVIFMIPICIFASFFIFTILDLIKSEKNKKTIFLVILGIILISNFYILFPYIKGTSAIFVMRDYAIENFDNTDIIVADARIYRGRIAFMFNDKHYIESSNFAQLVNQMNQINSSKIPVDVYYIECVVDDCGWGTIKDQPDFNQSMEQLTDYFKYVANPIGTISGGGADLYAEKSEPFFNIYHIQTTFNPQIFSLVDSTHEWFYYPVLWKGDRYDSYELDTLSKNLLHNSAYFILWIAIIIAILSSSIPIWELKKDKPQQTNS
jgi:hypothetical protein